MKILFSTPPAHYLQAYTFEYPRFPWLSPVVLAATVRGAHDVRIVSQTHRRASAHGLDAEIAAFKPDVLAFGSPAPISSVAMTENLPRIRKNHPRLKIIVGGQYPTFNPAPFLWAGCDLVALGEADLTFPRIIEAVEQGLDFRRIEGVAFLEDGALKVNPNTHHPEDLDTTPLPAFDLWPATNRTIYRKGVGATIETSRGCPHSCSFCVLPPFHGRFREKSAARVLEELRVLHALGVREVMFADGTFAASPQKGSEIFEAVASAELGMKFIAFLRADTVARNPDLVSLMARGGLEMAIVGFESYTDAGLLNMKKSATAQINAEAARILRKNGIYISGSHIYGLPPEGWREALVTFRRGVRNCDDYMAGIFTPIPGSPLHGELKKQGKLISDDPAKLNYTNVLVKDGPPPSLFRFATGMLYLAYQFFPRRLAQAAFGSKLPREVARSKLRLLFWRFLFAGLRKIGIRVL